MGRIVVSENISLDGVMQDPTGEEGLAVGGWFGRVSERDRAAFAELKSAESFTAEALLLGAASYQWFATRWATRPGAWADQLRSLPKYVVTSKPEAAGWGDTTVLSGEVVKAVQTLREQVDGDIVVYASGQLVPTLFEHGLVDELRLIVYPTVLGAGRRLYGATSGERPLRLTETRAVGDGLVLLHYQPAADTDRR